MEKYFNAESEHAFQNGALFDVRTMAEKAKDYKFEEIVATINPVNWVEKPQASWRKFPIFNQNGSGSCVAQTMAKLAGVLYWLKNQVYVHFSATHIYQRRYNKPAGGMAGVDAFNIASKGMTLESLVPSQNMTDQQMDSVVIPEYKEDVGEVFKIPNYVSLPVKDIETVASIIQTTGKAVMLWFFFEYSEWTERPVVKNTSLNLQGDGTLRHSVAGTDFTLYQGKKAIIIEDSWGPGYGLGGQRIIDEDFFKARNWFAAYPINFVFDDQTNPTPKPEPEPNPNPTPKPTPDRPRYKFNADLWAGQKSRDVIALQDILKYEGLFPANVSSTGYFGSITQKAVGKFQDKYNIAHSADAGYGRVGPKTRVQLNALYS